MAKPANVELPGVAPIPILYEDRSVLAMDKPRGWMLVPYSWQRTQRNLQAALVSSIAAGDFWARSRGLKFLRFVHRLDAETTGVMLFAKSQGAVESYSELFESRRMEKTYLAIVAAHPRQDAWTCRLKLGPDPKRIGRQRVDAREGKEAETQFRVLQRSGARALIEARPFTGRTHQIRIHLAESGCPIMGDALYGTAGGGMPNPGERGAPANRRGDSAERRRLMDREMGGALPRRRGAEVREPPMGLRAVRLAYPDPFTRRRVEIRAPVESFCREFGFEWKEASNHEQPR